MKRLLALVVAVSAVLVMAGGAMAAPPPARNFVAPLSGGEEVPPVDTTARGVATFQANKGDTALSFRLVASIEDVTQAHIHCGPFGVNGPVTVFLFGFVPGGVTVNGILSKGTVTDADVIALPDSPECPGGISSLADVLEKMRSGGAYVNAHTIDHPAGEIRGQIRAAGSK